MDVKDEIIKYCESFGISSVGFIKCRKFDELKELYIKRKELNTENEFEEEDINLRINSECWLKGGKTIITIAFPYFCTNNLNNGFSIYTQGLDYHLVLKRYLEQILDIIKKHGGSGEYFVDSNALPERFLAYIGGVGFIGKNNLLITKEYGSYVFLGEIITDLEIYDEDKRKYDEIEKFRECGECSICYGECPSKAINSNTKNCNICLSYITQKKNLEDWEIERLQGRLFGCDSCQMKCPYNEQIKFSEIKEFQQLEFMKNINENCIIEMGNAQFKETLKKTSCGWRGKNILKRNALIKKSAYLKEDISGIKFQSQYLNSYLYKLIKK